MINARNETKETRKRSIYEEVEKMTIVNELFDLTGEVALSLIHI